MLIPCSELSLVYGIHPHGILHVGAHEAEELESYDSYGWGPVIWVEMLPEKFERLKQRFEGIPTTQLYMRLAGIPMVTICRYSVPTTMEHHLHCFRHNCI